MVTVSLVARLPVQQLDPELPLPARPHETDVAVDLYARLDMTLSAVTGSRAIPTGIAVAVPEGHVGLVCSRSGLAASQGLFVLNAPGLIDPGYTGEIIVIMASVQERAQRVRRGMRIAQLLIQPATPFVVELVEHLPASQRGLRGLGSSGLRSFDIDPG
ncbi:MAG: dUTP diphosphatase [Actinomycetota bacterium]|nr:dUTP diphosphatase [Actinomycetota bacterium]